MVVIVQQEVNRAEYKSISMQPEKLLHLPNVTEYLDSDDHLSVQLVPDKLKSWEVESDIYPQVTRLYCFLKQYLMLRSNDFLHETEIYLRKKDIYFSHLCL